MKCIWCKNEASAEAEEHIIPDALGCPTGLVLRKGEVCRSCNNGLGHVDAALIREFEMLKFLAGVPSKKGRPPKIVSYSNVRGHYRKSGPHLEVNQTTRPVVSDAGEILKPASARTRSLRVTSTTTGPFVTMRFGQEGFCNSRLAVRALHKIAMGIYCKFYGNDATLSPDLNAVREYVAHDRGERTVLLFAADANGGYRNSAGRPGPDALSPFLMAFSLGCAGFMVDLTPGQTLLPKLKQLAIEKLGESGWTWAPIRHESP